MGKSQARVPNQPRSGKAEVVQMLLQAGADRTKADPLKGLGV